MPFISRLFLAILIATPGDGWGNLSHVTNARLYRIILRNGECRYGTLSSVGEQVLVVGADSGLGIAFKRAEIARISDELTDLTRGIVFSARSSWADVKAAGPTGTEYLLIVTKDGVERKWKHPAVSDDSIASEGVTIGKAEIRYAFYVRTKPLSIDDEYYHQRAIKLFAATPWFSHMIPGKISVPLYSSDVAEDNSPLTCH